MVKCSHCGEEWEVIPALQKAINDLKIRVYCGACSFVMETELRYGFKTFENDPADCDMA